MKNYSVRYWSLGEEHSGEVALSGNKTSVELIGLLKFTNYSIIIAAFTVGYSNYSTPVIVSTAEGGKLQSLPRMCSVFSVQFSTHKRQLSGSLQTCFGSVFCLY